MNARSPLEAYLAWSRDLVLETLAERLPPDGAHTGRLYERVMTYPLREAKGLRPALTLAVCRGLGGETDEGRHTATAIELFHNAFLVHDDVEDGSTHRRDGATLHREVGLPIAVNVGDGMLALALRPLLDNLDVIGVGRSLAVLDIVVRMARESAEGQAMELEWIRDNRWDLTERDYLTLVHKKTGWYSFIAPITAGAWCAPGTTDALVRHLGRFAMLLGIAFQIQDDLLNLTSAATGKEAAGDLWEGKRTLILLHALRHAAPADRDRALAILAKPRPTDDDAAWSAQLSALVAEGDLTPRGRDKLLNSRSGELKDDADVAFLLALVQSTGALVYARQTAMRYALRAAKCLGSLHAHLPPSAHRRFLDDVVGFVIDRTR
jgi:geranylgeranyl diphosphate synthase type II